MKKGSRIAHKKRIPKKPGPSCCSYTYEIEGEWVVMIVDCKESCSRSEDHQDICWTNLTKSISEGSLPDRIILRGKESIICDSVQVALLRNAGTLVRRMKLRIEELRNRNEDGYQEEVMRLSNLIKAILYDIPQLLDREIGIVSLSKGNRNQVNSPIKDNDVVQAEDILEKKRNIACAPSID